MAGNCMMRPLTEIQRFSTSSRFRCGFNGKESAKNNSFAANIDVGHPPVFITGNSRNSAGIVFVRTRPIPAVLRSICWPQIYSSVVEDVSINMVYPGRVAFIQTKYNAMYCNLRVFRATYSAFAKAPFFSGNQMNIGGVNNGVHSVKTNFNVCNITSNGNFRRRVAFPSLSGGYCG